MRAHGTPLVDIGERKLGESLVYNLVRFVGAPFSYDVIGYENVNVRGPAIYLTNHLGAIGPLAVMLSVPIRFYPWVVSEMMDYKRAPQYLYDDFVHPVMHLSGKIGMLFSALLTKIAVRLFRSIDAVSIDRFGGLTVDGFRHSLRLLNEGKCLLIFPEDALLPLAPETSMRHFMPGFASLCHIFLSEKNTLLPVYPLAVHAESETVSIGKAQYFHPQKDHRQAIDNFTLQMEDLVRGLYLDLKKCYNETLA